MRVSLESQEDLDSLLLCADHNFPSPSKRKTSSYIIALCAITFSLIGVFVSNSIMIVSGVLSLFIAVFFFVTSWKIVLDDTGALLIAAPSFDFPIGPSSAQLCFIGWLSKPIWRVVVFSADEHEPKRGLIEIDAITREVISVYVQENVESEM